MRQAPLVQLPPAPSSAMQSLVKNTDIMRTREAQLAINCRAQINTGHSQDHRGDRIDDQPGRRLIDAVGGAKAAENDARHNDRGGMDGEQCEYRPEATFDC